MINSQEIKKGTCIRMDGGIWKCIWFEHRKPGKGNTVMNTKLKNVADGRVLDRTFQVGFKLDDVRVEHRSYQYLYEDPTGCIFMNQETFEQFPISRDLITGGEYMKEGDIVDVQISADDGSILSAEMPLKTNLMVTHSEPGVKGTPLPTPPSLPHWRQVLRCACPCSSTRATLSPSTLRTAAMSAVLLRRSNHTH